MWRLPLKKTAATICPRRINRICLMLLCLMLLDMPATDLTVYSTGRDVHLAALFLSRVRAEITAYFLHLYIMYFIINIYCTLYNLSYTYIDMRVCCI